MPRAVEGHGERPRGIGDRCRAEHSITKSLEDGSVGLFIAARCTLVAVSPPESDVTDEDLERAALDAIASAAERLGVDPFRLARFLAHGRIADFLQALGRAEALEIETKESMELSTTYLAFLDEESRLRQNEGSGGGAANGG